MNKIDARRPTDVARAPRRARRRARRLRRLRAALGATGDGVDALVGELEARLPEGPMYYPEGVVTDQPETFLAAELVREQLLRVARDELPHSIAVTARGARGARTATDAPAPGDRAASSASPRRAS